VAKTDGTVFTGVLLEQSPEGALIFADSQGRLISVKTDEIAERKPQTTSIMPDNLPRLMTTQEFRDLLAYLAKGITGGTEGKTEKTPLKRDRNHVTPRRTPLRRVPYSFPRSPWEYRLPRSAWSAQALGRRSVPNGIPAQSAGTRLNH
jgi:hypothetical protein